jgi:hypothetical protein
MASAVSSSIVEVLVDLDLAGDQPRLVTDDIDACKEDG